MTHPNGTAPSTVLADILFVGGWEPKAGALTAAEVVIALLADAGYSVVPTEVSE